MKPFAKLTHLTSVVMLVAALVLAACSPATTPTAAPAPTEPPATAAPATAVPTAVPPTAAPTDVPPTAAPEPITIRYANWNLGTEEENNIQRQLIKAYTDAHPNVTIEIVDMSGEGNWEEHLTAYAAKGELPDVFMCNNVPLYVQNGWLADVSDLVANDADWANVPQALKDMFTFDGKVLGVPAAQFIMGYWVNKDVYEAANLDAPEYGVSAEDFFAAAEALNNPAKGMLGLDEQEFVMGWYPSSQDPNLKFFGFDGTNMNYNSDAFKAAVVKYAEIKPMTWQSLTDAQKKNFKSQGPWELFLNQEAGVRWDASWNVPGWVQNATFNWDFVGIPGGNQALVADVMAVSKTAKDVAAAYDFMKWMTFSKAAYALEAELAQAAGSAPKLPVSLDAESLALYKSFVDKPGINAALDNLDNSLVESLAKFVPGYINARWEGKPGIDIGEDKDVNMWYMFNFSDSGKYKYEDFAAKLEEFANKQLADAKTAMENALK